MKHTLPRPLTLAGIALLSAFRMASASEVECAPKVADLVALEQACLKLAQQGDVSAQSNLGWLYDGLIPNRLAESANWYRRAAEQGDARSQNNLGSKYLRGRGVLKDYGEALAWFRKSARQGFGPAQGNLCLMYADGLGVPKDNVKAYAWCNIATATAPASQDEAGGYAEVRDSVEAKMSPEDVIRAQEKSKECVTRNYAGCD